MPLYAYKAVDPSGKVSNSVIEAGSEKDAVNLLQNAGLMPIRISVSSQKESKVSGLLSIDILSFFQRVSPKDVMHFTQDLTALLEAGLPVDRSLGILLEATESLKFKETIKDILKAIEGGVSLSEALGRHPKVFSDFYINMIKAGEAGGILSRVLERLGIFLETSQELKDYIKSAMIYPLFLLGVGGLSIIVLMTYVIPNFSVIFADMGDAIPWSTKLLLDASHAFRSYWWVGIIVVACIYIILRKLLKSPKGKIRFDALKMKLPFVGDLIRKIEVGRISRTLGTLIESGVPILNAIILAKDIVSNQIITRAMDGIYNKVKEGENLSHPLSQTDIFPSLAIHMIRVGEETGNLSGMLLKLSDNYEKVVKNLVKRIVSLMEPVMILIMGVVIGSIVVSMLMAIFSMNDISF
ncbi:type II secretion system F family protein [uncultured Desulfobacter sp.]|uniref:type II secretion system F family protein n=1 Tax=uncultured Desulfobacter sp. TaxID=240139 RepID=UPI002AAB08AB|nr:type II secretion system F family protein [uncultured Desulfobacter sp.]